MSLLELQRAILAERHPRWRIWTSPNIWWAVRLGPAWVFPCTIAADSPAELDDKLAEAEDG
jgi:hypothetical protein